ncbi:5'/3'-nucleotidase SurE [Catenuloplanes atrovinosus]|uniref:5'-nucleotidase n=1 Tax=Catenuloplanes atrovinosus TaxID=137266 RepID=A0AAE3YTP2_9ACTN|nr:5'/3'-nucleotidase SurE [Catenuloplanes atrovinosus]MDR7278461.1 5'-nucleotidase [Catenuloplanes atrovinosus]
MRVLITNDDGIDAIGLRSLAAAAVKAGHEVVVAAPRTEHSGYSAALIAAPNDDGQIVVEPHTFDELPDVPAYGVAASPAFIVVLALRDAFGRAPDVVLSGPNRGANAGHAVLHSGTVGAALTAASGGLSAIAVSLDVVSPLVDGGSLQALSEVGDDRRHWDTAATAAVNLLATLTGLPAGSVLNLNVPDVPAEELKGVRRAAPAGFGQVSVALEESGEGYLRTGMRISQERAAPGTDLALLADGFATVTPLTSVDDDRSVELALP